jgi:hypothetical protein
VSSMVSLDNGKVAVLVNLPFCCGKISEEINLKKSRFILAQGCFSPWLLAVLFLGPW